MSHPTPAEPDLSPFTELSEELFRRFAEAIMAFDEQSQSSVETIADRYPALVSAWESAARGWISHSAAILDRVRAVLRDHLPAQLQPVAEEDLFAFEQAVAVMVARGYPRSPTRTSDDPPFTQEYHLRAQHRGWIAYCCEAVASACHALDKFERHRSYFQAPAGNLPGADEDSDRKVGERTKVSTTNGDARAKLIAAFAQHHKYANGFCEHTGPIGCRELAALAKVSDGAASMFMKEQFGGHNTYVTQCDRTIESVARKLKMLQGDFTDNDLRAAIEADRRTRSD